MVVSFVHNGIISSPISMTCKRKENQSCCYSSVYEFFLLMLKMIKTTTRNTMTDDHLSDLCSIAVEHDIELKFEQLIDIFVDVHKSSGIMLK
jgi:hypothetical protein